MMLRNLVWPAAAAAVAVLLLLPAAWSQGQPAAPVRPQFEVASLKPK